MKKQKKNLTLREYLMLEKVRKEKKSPTLMLSSVYANEDQKRFGKKLSEIQRQIRKQIKDDKAYLLIHKHTQQLKGMFCQFQKKYNQEVDNGRNLKATLHAINVSHQKFGCFDTEMEGIFSKEEDKKSTKKKRVEFREMLNLKSEDEVVESSIINKLSMKELKLDFSDEKEKGNTLKKIFVCGRKQEREKSVFFEENGKSNQAENFLTVGPSTFTEFYSHKDANQTSSSRRQESRRHSQTPIS